MVSTELTAEQVIEKKLEEERLKIQQEKEKAEVAEKEARQREEEKEMLASQNVEVPKKDMTAKNIFDTLADNGEEDQQSDAKPQPEQEEESE